MSVAFSFIQVNNLVLVTYAVDKLHHIRTAYDKRGTVVVRVKTDLFGFRQGRVDKKEDLVLHVVDKREKTYRTRLHAEIATHTLGRGKREFALMQLLFHAVDVHLMTAVHDDKVMTVAFVVAEEKILA